ncbi:hypothetical protein DSL72_003109 [Monilinia vaccinii-corymbosi]|uniref:Uncharacterized protein n=1 Tax=Monilinia vaccinii-corymbosi TaxID=61207 RepID=A0A8A3NX46_9HELO|nr:hypothetical protein DSL72_003109 [Monilinia vaccinii-corymbosi]
MNDSFRGKKGTNIPSSSPRPFIELAQNTNALPSKKTGQSRLSSKGRIPAALRNYIPSDGLYKIVSCDLGSGYKSILIASDLVPVNGYYNVNWAIFAETTGIGIDFWCAVCSNDQDLNNGNDLVGVIQQSYTVDNDSIVEQNDDDNE